MYRKAEIKQKRTNSTRSRTNMIIDNSYSHVPLYGSLKSRTAMMPVPIVMANHEGVKLRTILRNLDLKLTGGFSKLGRGGCWVTEGLMLV